MGLLQIKPHSRSKYRILSKYLGACKFFSQKYENFAYVETHGGTGKVYDLEKDEQNNGSVLRAAKMKPKFPCYVVEIDDENYRLLEDSIQAFSNVKLFHGDCNEKIDIILKEIPKGKKFVLFFLDPDSLSYNEYDQLKWKSVEKIAKFPRSEILLNFPLLAITRCASAYQHYPEAFSYQKMAERITRFYGTDRWKELEANDRQSLLKLYILERLNDFNYKGAVLIRSLPTRGPLYYLVYGSKYEKGGVIMRDIMKKEWVDNILGHEPITRHFYETYKKWLDAEYPLSRFIFED